MLYFMVATARQPVPNRGRPPPGLGPPRDRAASRLRLGGETAVGTAFTPVQRDSYLPFYVQIKQQLKEHIQRLKAEASARGQPLTSPIPFYSDDELVKAFGVSRMTVRQAVDALVQEGLLYRVRGVGTFISPPKIQGQLKRLEAFFEEWALQGKQVSVDIHQLDTRPCPEAAAAWLGVEPGTPILYIKRTRLADGIPTALDERFIPYELGQGITREDVSKEAIFMTLIRKFNVPIGEARIEISAVEAGPEEADLLKVPRGAALLLRNVVMVDDTGKPVLAGRSLYRPDLFKYSTTLSVK